MFYGCTSVSPAVNSSDKSTFTTLSGQFSEPLNNSLNMMKSMTMQGTPDYAFSSMMVMQHQGVMNMAKIEQQNGKDPEMKKLADDVIARQGNETTMLNSWMDKYKAGNGSMAMMDTSQPFAKSMMGSVDSSMMGMQNMGMGMKNQCSATNTDNNCTMGMGMNKAFASGNPDYIFAAMMTIPHQNAMDMANAELASGKDEDMKKLAQTEVNDQQKELQQLRDWMAKNTAK